MRGLPLPILRVPQPVSVAEAKVADVRARLEGIFESVRFPVRRWQLVAAADHLGSDSVTRQALRDLYAETYPDALAVVEEMVSSSSIGRALEASTRRGSVPG